MHMSARNKVLNNSGHWTKFAVMKEWTTTSRNWKFTTSTHLLLCGQHSHNLSAVMSRQLLQLVNMSNFFCPPSLTIKVRLDFLLHLDLTYLRTLRLQVIPPQFQITFSTLSLSLCFFFFEKTPIPSINPTIKCMNFYFFFFWTSKFDKLTASRELKPPS